MCLMMLVLLPELVQVVFYLLSESPPLPYLLRTHRTNFRFELSQQLLLLMLEVVEYFKLLGVSFEHWSILFYIQH